MFSITWIDAGRDPKVPPDPHYPDGMDVDLSLGVERACRESLPYPAKRCGHYVVVCQTCKQRVVVTTAGRVDDPRSLKLGCRDPA